MKQTSQARSSNLMGDVIRLKKLWPYLRDDRRLMYIAAALIPLVSALQAFLPLVLKRIIDNGILKGQATEVWTWALVFLSLTILTYACRIGQSMIAATAVYRMVRTLRQKMVDHILHLASSYHDRTLSGTLVTRATSDFDNLNESLNQGVLTSMVDIAVLFGCVVGLFLLDFRLALVAFVLLPTIYLVVTTFSRLLKKAMLEARVKIAALNAFTQEALYASSTIKSLTAEASAQKRFDDMNIQYRDAQMKSVVYDAMMFAVIDGIAAISIGVVLWIACQQYDLTSFLSAGVLVAFVTYLQQLFEPLKMLGNKIAMLQGAFTSIDRIFGVLDHDESIKGDFVADKLQGHIQFVDLSFAYSSSHDVKIPTQDPKTTPSEADLILNHLTFEVLPGQSLAIVGPTGSGKSTIIKLLSRLYDYQHGHILIDGRELKSYQTASLRQKMSVVPQDIVLFDGDLYFNIGLGAEGISKDMIEAAAHAVGADEFIDKLPQKYETPLREQGSLLSHGQRQLIVFARALARRPSLVILDEATSSVDHQSEQAIQVAIDSLLQGRSVMVIAHRLSTIRRCDKILVMDQGRAVEVGSYQELMARKGAYYALETSLNKQESSN